MSRNLPTKKVMLRAKSESIIDIVFRFMIFPHNNMMCIRPIRIATDHTTKAIAFFHLPRPFFIFRRQFKNHSSF